MSRAACLLAILSSCISMPHELPFLGGNISELHTACVTYVDSEGFLRGRTALFNSGGLSRILRDEWSYRGACDDQRQGPASRVVVCLAHSSACAHDRTTGVWPDEVEKYFERYPGSYHGRCEKEELDCCAAMPCEDRVVVKEEEPPKMRGRR